ncbi:aminoglycoside phosphotransferase family protein [Nonomuraea sp. NPDC047529]|uniref:aminoglycoside phosphotransferase family protein n=1 Tax=Nonomuraea sp. NPDC047529 TaxID=3155623 RepID=UPI0033EBDCDB
MQSGGFTPGVAVRLDLGATRVFVKAIKTGHVLAAKYRTEAATAAALPHDAPTPDLLWHGEGAGWVVLIFEDVQGSHPDLRPASPDIAATVTALATMGDTLTPSPLDLPPASATRGGWLHGWAELAACPPDDLGGWEQRFLPKLAELESLWIAHADGNTLVHGDIRPDNMLITAHGSVVVVDWAQPCNGAAWQDVTDLIPHLIMAGNTPQMAEKALLGLPAWTAVPPDVITSYATAYAGYWSRMSRQPAPAGVPHLRAYQRQASKAALAWVMYRTGW